MQEFKNKIILINNSLYTVDDIREDENLIIFTKLESDGDVLELEISDMENFDFYKAREDAVTIMNETRFFDNVVSKQPNSVT